MQQPAIEYTKKARHGHGQDVVNEDNIRQVAGCLPIDIVNCRILLISSSKHEGRFVIPKGGWEEDETQAQAALRETWEEAGIKGRVIRQLGVFEEATKKHVKAHHWIFELEIQEVCKKFPEKKKRERRWFTYDEAMQVVKSQYIKDALKLSCLNPTDISVTKIQTGITPLDAKIGTMTLNDQSSPASTPPLQQQQQQQQQKQQPAQLPQNEQQYQLQKEKERLEQEKLKIQQEKLNIQQEKQRLEHEKHLLQEQQSPPAPTPEKNEHHSISNSIKAFFKK
ncbi:unnamed protein product [Cunninghamella echinulata]